MKEIKLENSLPRKRRLKGTLERKEIGLKSKLSGIRGLENIVKRRETVLESVLSEWWGLKDALKGRETMIRLECALSWMIRAQRHTWKEIGLINTLFRRREREDVFEKRKDRARKRIIRDMRA